MHTAATEIGPTPSGDEAYRLQLAVTRLARLLRQEVEVELTPSQISALSTIRRRGPVTLGELADLERVAPPSITRMVARLEREGYVERIPDASDGRVCRVVVTESAEELVSEARRRKASWLSARIAELGAEDRDNLRAAVSALEAIAGLR